MREGFLKRVWKNVVALALVAGLFVGISTSVIACTKPSNDEDEKKQGVVEPGNTTETPVDSENTNNTENSENPNNNENSENPNNNENSEKPDDQKPDDQKPGVETPTKPSEEELVAQAHQKLENAITEKFGETSTWTIDENTSVFYCYEVENGNANLYSKQLSKTLNMATAEGMESITADVKAMEKSPIATFAFSNNNLKYNGYEYNMGAIKGANPFANKLGITGDSIVTSLEASITNNVLSLDIKVLSGSKTTLGRVSGEIEEVIKLANYDTLTDAEKKTYDAETFKKLSEEYNALSEAEQREYNDKLIGKLLGENTKVENKQSITFGIQNLSAISALTPTILPEIEKPTPDTPTPGDEETLDYSKLEEKLVEIFENYMYGAKVDEIVSLSKSEDEIYVAYKYTINAHTDINIFKCTGMDFESVDSFEKSVKSLSEDSLNGLGMAISLASSDITVNGVTYSKDGIKGDNPFARACGVENARLTFVSRIGGQSFADFDTGYGRKMYVLIISDDNDHIEILHQTIAVESRLDYSDEKIYSNMITEGKTYLIEEEKFIIGQNIKTEQTHEIKSLN